MAGISGHWIGERWNRICLNVSFFYHVRTIKQIGVSEKSFLEGRKNVSCKRWIGNLKYLSEDEEKKKMELIWYTEPAMLTGSWLLALAKRKAKQIERNAMGRARGFPSNKISSILASKCPDNRYEPDTKVS